MEPTIKSGYRTTEFWLTAFASVVGLAFASGVFATESNGVRMLGRAASVLASLGYTVSRAIVKK